MMKIFNLKTLRATPKANASDDNSYVDDQEEDGAAAIITKYSRLLLGFTLACLLLSGLVVAAVVSFIAGIDRGLTIICLFIVEILFGIFISHKLLTNFINIIKQNRNE